MKNRYVLIAEQVVHFKWESSWVGEYINKSFYKTSHYTDNHDITISIHTNYGSPFINYEVDVTKSSTSITFRRADYLIEATHDYKSVTIYVHDVLALKHALMNLYSSYIVYHNWGLLLHSSCVIDSGKAHVFTGHSGAGKSTAAMLSYPKELLSDEASIIKITPNEVRVFNSPFRSELEVTGTEQTSPLASIQLLHQSSLIRRKSVKKSDAYLELVDKIFYWSHSKEETTQALNLLNILIQEVPVYELYFQKNNAFWELIS